MSKCKDCNKDLAPNGKPKVSVALVGEDGNAFAILGRVSGAMRRAGWTKEEIGEYTKKAMKGDYDNLLRVTMEYTNDSNSEDIQKDYDDD